MENSADLTAFIEEEYMQEDEDKPPDCGITTHLRMLLSARSGESIAQIKFHWKRFNQLNIAFQGAFAPLFCGLSALTR